MELMNSNLNNIIRKLYQYVPNNILYNFFISREKSLNKFYFRKKYNLNKKLSLIKIRETQNIKPRKYFARINEFTQNNNVNSIKKFTFHKGVEFNFNLSDIDLNNTIHINIDPHQFEQKEPFDIDMMDSWFVQSH